MPVVARWGGLIAVRLGFRVIDASSALLWVAGSGDGAELPGHEFLLAQVELLTDRLLPGGYGKDAVEDLVPDPGERVGAVDDRPAVEVYVLRHPAVEVGARGELDAGHRLAPEDRPAAGGEAHDRGAARDDAGDRDRVVAGRVHEDETGARRPLGILDDLAEVGVTALGDRAQRLLQDGRETAGLVAGGGVVVHRAAAGGRVGAPPVQPVEQLATDRFGDRAPGEQPFRPVDFRGLAEDGGAAIRNQPVGGDTERGVGRDARKAVRATAVEP